MRVFLFSLLFAAPFYDNGAPFYDSPRSGSSAAPANALFDFNPGSYASTDSLSDDLCFSEAECTTAEVVCNGDDAGATAWACDTGGSLAKVEDGADFTINAGSPLLGASDDSVLLAAGDFYQSASATVGDIGGTGAAVEILFKTNNSGGGPRPVAKMGAGSGWDIKLDGAGLIRMTINDGSSTVQPSCGSSSFTEGDWNHVMLFWDTSVASTDGFTCVVNGQVQGSGLDVSALGSITSTANFTIGARSDGIVNYTGEVAHVKVWDGVPAKTSAQRVTEANIRFQKMIGLNTDDTGAPSVFSRGSSAYLDKYDGATRKMYKVGAQWLRTVSRKDSVSTLVKGFLYENLPSGVLLSNLILQSSTFDNASWAKVNSAVSADSQSTPEDVADADSIVGDGTAGEHGVTQAATLTAVRHTFSVYAKAGNQDWLYLEDATLTNAYSYFDLSTCSLGTAGAGIVQAHIEGDWLNGFCRVGIQFVGTAAAHTLRILSAEADGDKSFTGDSSTANSYIWAAQAEVDDYFNSPIETTTATIAASKDQLRYPGTFIVAAGGSTACTFLAADVDPISGGDLHGAVILFHAERDTLQDALSLRNENTYDKLNWTVFYNALRDIDIKPDFPGFTPGSSFTDNTRHTLAADWQLGLHRMWFNGVETDDSPQADNEIATSYDYMYFGSPGVIIEQCVVYDAIGVSSVQ